MTSTDVFDKLAIEVANRLNLCLSGGLGPLVGSCNRAAVRLITRRRENQPVGTCQSFLLAKMAMCRPRNRW
jgi:hypothetical protein